MVFWHWNLNMWTNWQEVDLGKYTTNTFYSGAKKLLGKQTVLSVHIHGGLLFAGGSSVDGVAGKVRSIILCQFFNAVLIKNVHKMICSLMIGWRVQTDPPFPNDEIVPWFLHTFCAHFLGFAKLQDQILSWMLVHYTFMTVYCSGRSHLRFHS